MHSTSLFHNYTAFLPLYTMGAALIASIAGWKFRRNLLPAVNWLLLLTALATTVTCGFGGASIRAAESMPGVNILILQLHAWTAMASFLLALLLAYLSYKSLRGKNTDNPAKKNIFWLSGLFLLFFAVTTFLAFRIR